MKHAVTCAVVVAAFTWAARPVMAQPPQAAGQAVQADAPLPSAVEPILRKAAAAVKNNFKAFERENEKPLNDAQKSLTKLVTSFNDLRETEKAAAIQNLKNDLKSVVLERAGAVDLPAAAEPAPPTDAAAPPAPPAQAVTPSLLRRLQGRWAHPNFRLVYEFGADGGFMEVGIETAEKHAGFARDLGDGVVEVKVNMHRLEVAMAGDDRIAVLVWDPQGKPLFTGLVLTRQNPGAAQIPNP